MRMRVSIDFYSGESSNRSASYNVARPVKLIVDSRYTCEGRPSVENWTDNPSRAWPPVTRLRRDNRRERECCCGVAGRKRLIVGSAVQPAHQSEIQRVR